MPAPLRPLSKTETAYRLLRSEILQARLPPGLALKLTALAQTYGLSWTPLREALSRLEADRLVVVQHNRGYSVAPLRSDDLADLQRARLAVELPALLESMRHGGLAWECGLQTALEQLGRCPSPLESRSPEHLAAWELAHEQFHSALLAGCPSPWLSHFQQQIADQLHRYHHILGTLSASAASANPPHSVALAHHSALAHAALARDVAQVTTLLHEHVQSTLEVFQPSAAASSTSSISATERPQVMS